MPDLKKKTSFIYGEKEYSKSRDDFLSDLTWAFEYRSKMTSNKFIWNVAFTKGIWDNENRLKPVNLLLKKFNIKFSSSDFKANIEAIRGLSNENLVNLCMELGQKISRNGKATSKYMGWIYGEFHKAYSNYKDDIDEWIFDTDSKLFSQLEHNFTKGDGKTDWAYSISALDTGLWNFLLKVISTKGIDISKINRNSSKDILNALNLCDFQDKKINDIIRKSGEILNELKILRNTNSSAHKVNLTEEVYVKYICKTAMEFGTMIQRQIKK